MKCFISIFFLLASLCILNVRPMSLKGPVITRYGPCGLAMIHFDKITNKTWKGVMHFSAYINIFKSIELQLSFEKQVIIYAASQNSTFSVKNDLHEYLIKPTGRVSNQYVFFLELLEESENNVPVVKKLTLNNMTLCDDDIKASQTVNTFNVTKKNDTKLHHMCGRRALDHAELNYIKTDAKAGDWPWHVALMIRDLQKNITRYECGGNIISTTAILTAGHCVSSKDGSRIEPQRIVILAGIGNLYDTHHPGRQTLNAEKVILHPAFNYMQATSDLAIIRVKYLKFTEYVQPVCIWGPVYDRSSLFGREATVVGFGTTEDNKLSDTLRSAYIMVQNDSTCIAYSPKLYDGLLNEFTFCAGYGPTSGINPRNGDSGGGLVVATVQPDHKISWFLRGTLSKCGVSPGHTECDPKFYVVYTDVGPHYGWIYHNAGLQFRSNILS